MFYFNHILLLSLILQMEVTSLPTVNYFGNIDFREDQSKVSFTVSGCNEEACSRSCRRLDYLAGNCKGDRCDCLKLWAQDKILKDLAIIIEQSNKTLSANQKIDVPEECSEELCHEECERNGSPSGDCINHNCICERSKAENDNILAKQDFNNNDSLKCNLLCHKHCRSLGFLSGDCTNRKCDCSQFVFTKGKVQDSKPVTEENVTQSSICQLDSCNNWCQRFNYSKGVCVLGKCDCLQMKVQRLRTIGQILAFSTEPNK